MVQGFHFHLLTTDLNIDLRAKGFCIYMYIFVSLCVGTTDIIRDVEKTIARFVGKPDAIVFGMGFATNSTNLPALVNKVRLALSQSHFNDVYCNNVLCIVITMSMMQVLVIFEWENYD